MNNDKRIFAFVSLGLFLLALLAPFIIAVFGRGGLAIGFSAVAGFLALPFGLLSWSDRIGRTVAVTLIFILIVGIGGSAVVYTIRGQVSGAMKARVDPPTGVVVPHMPQR